MLLIISGILNASQATSINFIDKNDELYNTELSLRYKNNKKMNKYTSHIVNQFLNQQFLPHLWSAINDKQTEKKVERHMARVISNDMLVDLLDSTAKNNSITKKTKHLDQFAPIYENHRKPEGIKLPMKKYKKSQSAYFTLDQIHSEQSQSLSPLVPKHQSSSLIKLPAQYEDQNQQVQQIRKIKERMRRFEKQIQERASHNAYANQQSARKKKSVHSQCKYHTYDYSANIMPVELQNYAQHNEDQKQSLLQSLKKNLDKQIQEQETKKKLKQIQKNNQKVNFKVPSHKIHKMEGNKEPSADVNAEKLQTHKMPMKPLFKFQLSYIESLSKQFQKYIEGGVKMVTHEEKIVEQTQNPQQPQFLLKKQKCIHQKKKSAKQNTVSSQSIIYSLENKIKKSPIDENKSEESNKLTKKYQSLQLEREEQESKLSLYQPIAHKQIKSTLNTPATNDIKLPQIRFNQQGRRLPKKRTATQQKIIKGLDHIEIDLKSPNKSEQSRSVQRSGLFSAFSINKHTESSVIQSEYDISVGANRKRSFIKDYFNNYGNQFRFKRQLMDKLYIHS